MSLCVCVCVAIWLNACVFSVLVGCWLSGWRWWLCGASGVWRVWERRKQVNGENAWPKNIYSSWIRPRKILLTSIEIWHYPEITCNDSYILKGRPFDCRKRKFKSFTLLSSLFYSMEWGVDFLPQDSCIQRDHQWSMMEAMAILLFWENNDGSGGLNSVREKIESEGNAGWEDATMPLACSLVLPKISRYISLKAVFFVANS